VIAIETSRRKAIRLQVCYFQSDNCIHLEVPGYSRKQAVIGNMPSESSEQAAARMAAAIANGGYRAIRHQEQPFLLEMRAPEFLDLPHLQA
jgi:hypothetical protein